MAHVRLKLMREVDHTVNLKIQVARLIKLQMLWLNVQEGKFCLPQCQCNEAFWVILQEVLHYIVLWLMSALPKTILSHSTISEMEFEIVSTWFASMIEKFKNLALPSHL